MRLLLRSRLKRFIRWPMFRRLVVAVPLFGLALWIIVADLSADRAWPVAAFLLIGLLVLVVPPEGWQKFLSRVENAQIGPLGVGLRQEVEEAAEMAPPSDKGEGAADEWAEQAETVFELRMQLEWKLAFIAKHLLSSGGGVTYVTIGSLLFDGYLTETEARTATGILSARDEELKELPEAERRKFVEDAQTFLDGLRASVFWGQVKRVLEGRGEVKGEDIFLERVRGTGGRSDLLADADREEVRVIPILALEEGSDKLAEAVEAIDKGKLPRPRTKRQVIVVPDSSATERPERPDVQIVELSELRDTLEQPLT